MSVDNIPLSNIPIVISTSLSNTGANKSSMWSVVSPIRSASKRSMISELHISILLLSAPPLPTFSDNSTTSTTSSLDIIGYNLSISEISASIISSSGTLFITLPFLKIRP